MLQTKTLSILGARFVALLLPAFCLASAALAQPGGAYVTKTDYSGTYLNFSDGSTWVGDVAPSDSANVTISNCLVTMDTDMTLGTITILSSGRLKLASSTVTIIDQLLNNASGGISDSGGSSTVIFTSTVADGGSGSPTIGGSNDVTLYNVQLNNGSVTDFHSGATGEAETFITNELTLKGGAVVVNPPVYADGSTLKYDSIYTVGLEWTPNLSSGKGVPHDVVLGTSASLDFGSTANNYTCTGGFTLDAASASVDISDMTGTLTVDEGFTMGSTNSVTLNVPSTHVTGKLVVGGDLTFGTNTTLSGDSSNVEVRGNLTNSLTGAKFRHLKFNGSSDQDITGNLITVDSLVVANTQNTATDDTDVDFQANVDITAGGVFNPVDGTSKITGTFTMNSDATGTARIATLADAGATSDVHGDITFERYVPSTASTSWLMMGNYVTGTPALTVQSWIDDFGGSIYVYSHSETEQANGSGLNNNNGWSYQSSSTSLSPGEEGYFVIAPSSLGTSGHTLSSTGSYNASSVNVTVSHTNNSDMPFHDPAGWNLLVNPYPSPIDGDAFVSNTSISEYYVFDNGSGNWLSSGQTGLLEAPSAIDVGQAFFAYVASGNGGTATFTTDLAIYGDNTFVREVDPAEQAIFAVKITDEQNRFGTTTIRLHEEGMIGYQNDLDLPYKAGASANPRIWTVIEEIDARMAVNTPGTIDDVSNVPLVVQAGLSSEVSIDLDDFTSIEEGLCVRIVDNETGEAVALGSGAMNLVLEPGELYENRFTLEFITTPIFSSTVSHCEGGTIHFNGDDSEDWLITWENSEDELEGTGCVSNLDPGNYSLDAVNMFNGCVANAEIEIGDVCMGDFNFSGNRDIPDLLMLLVNLQPSNNSSGNLLSTDCDCDGLMTISDLLLFLPSFGENCNE